MTDIIINDLDENTVHRVQVPRPESPDDPPLRYAISFLTTAGVMVQHWMMISFETHQYQISVKGRFVIRV